MSVDYAFWKTPNQPLSRGLIYLLLCQGLPIEELEPVGIEPILNEIDSTFPDCADSPRSFDLHTQREGFILTTHGNASPEVETWFMDLARRYGMTVFDPQNEAITMEDQAARTLRARGLEAADEAVAHARNLPDLERAVLAGDVGAISALAQAYYFGEGVHANLPRAFELYRLAAERGSEEAMFNLASCYLRGEGTAKDADAAIRWYENAARTDGLYAPFALGELYSRGEGVPVSVEEAIRWFRVALEHGHLDAPKRLRSLGAAPLAPNR